MIIMSVDIGTVRTGIAISDKGETMAFPRDVIIERDSEKAIDLVCLKAKEYKAELIVVGLPKNMDGSLGFKAEECTAASKKIEEKSGIKTVLYDERCTTVIAHNLLKDNNLNSKKRKNKVDAVAAVMILESYLNFKKNKDRC